MRKAEPMTTPAFPEPNHTQTPNNFFDMVPNMTEAELRVTIVMIRNTFGWHRESFKMGVDELAKAAGLSRQGTLDGAAAAEKRGTFRRSNPGQNKKAEWELVVALQPVDPSTGLRAALQPVEGNPPVGRGLSGVKESKENKNKYSVFSQRVTDERREMLKLAERIEAGIGLTPDFTNSKWEKTVREIVRKEAGGQSFDAYAKWLNGGNEYNRPKPFQIASNPKLILTTWAQAFIGNGKQPEYVPEPDWMDAARRRAERQNA